MNNETEDYVYLEIKSNNKIIAINDLDEKTRNNVLDDLKNIGLHFKSVDKKIIWVGNNENE